MNQEKVVDELVFVLATWRLTNMITSEDGPMGVFGRIRRQAGVKTVERTFLDIDQGNPYNGRQAELLDRVVDPEVNRRYTTVKNAPYHAQPTYTAKWFVCNWCMSIAVGAVLRLMQKYIPLTSKLIDILAVSAMAIWVDRQMK